LVIFDAVASRRTWPTACSLNGIRKSGPKDMAAAAVLVASVTAFMLAVAFLFR
jgi:hypothetical protein